MSDVRRVRMFRFPRVILLVELEQQAGAILMASTLSEIAEACNYSAHHA
jgi:hypothetical protein